MRAISHWFLLPLLLTLGSCALNPLRIPPPPHAMPTRHRPGPAAEAAQAPESRPEAVPGGFDAMDEGTDWREGDSLALTLVFDDGDVRQSFWLLIEVIAPPMEADDGSIRIATRTTLLEHDGTVVGVARRRIDPSRIVASSQELFDAYFGLVAAAAAGEAPEHIQETIDEEMGEGSPVFDAMKRSYRELRRTAAPRFVRARLKEPAINSSIGSISVLDMAMAAVAPVEVLVDVNRLNEEQQAIVDFTDIPVNPIRIPFVMTIGGSIQFRFTVTMAAPVPPYALAGGIIEVAGVNEARGDRRFHVQVAGAKRGHRPESRPESRPSPE